MYMKCCLCMHWSQSLCIKSRMCFTANPVIHPAITLLNLGRMEQQVQNLCGCHPPTPEIHLKTHLKKCSCTAGWHTTLDTVCTFHQGSSMLFYRDGVSPMVANLIEALDKERMALMTALGYHAESDPDMSVQQGYTESAGSYYECYGQGSVYGTFASPEGKTLATHRYFYEGIVYAVCGRYGDGFYIVLHRLWAGAGAVLQLGSGAGRAHPRVGGGGANCFGCRQA